MLVAGFTIFIDSNPLLCVSLVALSAIAALSNYAGSLIDMGSYKPLEGAMYGVLVSLLLTVTGFNPYVVIWGGIGLTALLLYKATFSRWAPLLSVFIVFAILINYGTMQALHVVSVTLIASAVYYKAPKTDFYTGLWQVLSAGAIYLAWHATI